MLEVEVLRGLTREDRESYAIGIPSVRERMTAEGWTSARYTLKVINREAKAERQAVTYNVRCPVTTQQGQRQHSNQHQTLCFRAWYRVSTTGDY
jgi:hypothetical protein